MTQYLIDSEGNTTGILLDVATYNALVEAAGELDTIHTYVAAKQAIDANHAVSVSLDEARALVAADRANPPAPLRDEERAKVEAVLDHFDRTAAEIGQAWQGDMSAAEAVSEQRRDL